MGNLVILPFLFSSIFANSVFNAVETLDDTLTVDTSSWSSFSKSVPGDLVITDSISYK